MNEKTYPSLMDLLTMIGDTGKRISEVEASEGTAGNISVLVRSELDVTRLFPFKKEISLGKSMPELGGSTIIVSGSSQRLREIGNDPTAHLACLVVDKTGQTAYQYTAPNCNFQKISSEFNSHLAVHYDQVVSTGTSFHAVIHAQPVHLTYLSHIPLYQSVRYLNTHLLRWQPEAIVHLPEGIGFAPFKVPGSEELVAENALLFRTHHIVVWAKHGIMACSDVSVMRAMDIIEYAEIGARYEYLNLSLGEIGDGLNVEEIRAICKAFNIKQSFF